jgi:RimJ/RimL family protein N-acetyltransferase
MERNVELTDDTILIRPCELADAQRVYEAVRESIAEVSPWAPWCRPEYSLEDARTWLASLPEAWAKGTDYDFAVVHPHDGAWLGGCGLNQFNHVHHFGNLGYWTRTSRTGRGIATAAVRLLARFGFEALKLKRIEIVAAVGNQASQQVAEKAGATREGVLRSRHVVRDKVYDAVMFSLLPQDILPVEES